VPAAKFRPSLVLIGGQGCNGRFSTGTGRQVPNRPRMSVLWGFQSDAEATGVLVCRLRRRLSSLSSSMFVSAVVLPVVDAVALRHQDVAEVAIRRQHARIATRYGSAFEQPNLQIKLNRDCRFRRAGCPTHSRFSHVWDLKKSIRQNFRHLGSRPFLYRCPGLLLPLIPRSGMRGAPGWLSFQVPVA
jgi:hypothetical protein